MTGRPRISTIVLSGLFVAVLALYFLVRPVAAPGEPVPPAVSPATGARPTGAGPSPTRSPARTRSPSPARSDSGPARTPGITRTPGPEATATPSPSPSSGSPAPIPGSPAASPASGPP